MRVIYILVSLFLTVAAHAEEQTVKIPVKEGFQKLDMQGFEGAKNAPKEKPKTKISIGCTDATGRTFSATDEGYQTCLMQTKSRSGNPSDKGSNTHLQFGN